MTELQFLYYLGFGLFGAGLGALQESSREPTDHRKKVALYLGLGLGLIATAVLTGVPF